MAKKMLVLSLLAVTLVSLGAFALSGFGREQRSGNKGDIGVVSEKIDEVLKNQQDIIARLDDIRKQQDIIRVRASQR